MYIGTELGGVVLLFMSPWSCSGDYADTGDESLKEEVKPVGEVKDQLARQDTLDMLGPLNTLQRIHKGLMM